MKTCAIVDPYSSSNLYAPALKKRGYECIAIQSQAEPTDIIANSLRKDDFVEILRFNGNIDEMAAELRKRGVEYVIPGMEMGIELADSLGEKMGSHFFNEPSTSHLRRHKFEMIEAARAHGLLAVQQIKSSNLNEAIAWVNEKQIWPVVVKPADSGGADRVLMCKNENDLSEAFRISLGSLGRQGRPIQEVVVQEFMRGTEYIVDAVSFQGRHMMMNIWKYNRVAINGAQFVYDTKELIAFDGDIQQQLIDYTRKALDAIGLMNGPSHSEVMMTAKGPMLVEVNPRFGGSNAPIVNRECVGFGQLDGMLDVILSPNTFLTYWNKPYQVEKHGMAVYFISKSDDRIVNGDMLEQIRSLPSCHSLRLMKPPGTKLVKTVDMFTMPGMVDLIHENAEQIRDDYLQIRKIEASGEFYIKAGKGTSCPRCRMAPHAPHREQSVRCWCQ